MDHFNASHTLVIRMPGILGGSPLWMDYASVSRERGCIPSTELSRHRV